MGAWFYKEKCGCQVVEMDSGNVSVTPCSADCEFYIDHLASKSVLAESVRESMQAEIAPLTDTVMGLIRTNDYKEEPFYDLDGYTYVKVKIEKELKLLVNDEDLALEKSLFP